MNGQDAHEWVKPHLVAHLEKAAEVVILVIRFAEVLEELRVIGVVLLPVCVIDTEVIVGAGGLALLLGRIKECVPVGLARGCSLLSNRTLGRCDAHDVVDVRAKMPRVGNREHEVIQRVEHRVLRCRGERRIVDAQR